MYVEIVFGERLCVGRDRYMCVDCGDGFLCVFVCMWRDEAVWRELRGCLLVEIGI